MFGRLGHAFGLLQPVDNLLDGWSVEAVHLPDLLHQLAVFFHQTAVQAIGYRSFVLGVLHGGIESLGLGLCHAVIVVTGRRQYQVFPISLVDALGHHLGVEDYGKDFLAQLLQCLSLGQRQGGSIYTLQSLTEKFGREAGHELLAAIVVMDAVGEPHALQVDLHCLEIGRSLVARIAGIDRLKHLSDDKVVLAVLVEEDVTTLQGGFREVIYQFLLVESQSLEPGYAVA